MIDEQLKEFGLSDKETKIYLTLLQLGTSPVREIALTAKLNRSTTYVVLDSLQRHELITVSEKTCSRRYTAISPELLIQKTANLISKYSKIEKDIESIIPNLNALSKKLEHLPRVLFYEGKEGVRSVLDGVLSQKKDSIIRTFSKLPITTKKSQPDYYDHLQNKRPNQKIKLLAIYSCSDSEKQQFNNTKIKSSLDEFIFLPSQKYSFNSNLSVYENKVILISPQDEYCVIIENEDISQTMKELFDLAWEEAKRVGER